MGSDSSEIVVGVGSWLVCSVGMLVFNKMAVTALPLECSLVALQLVFTALAMLVCCWGSLHVGSSKDLLRWLIVVPFFTGMLLTSMFALSSASMTTVVTFRAISPLVAMAVERFYPNPLRVTSSIVLCIVAMIAGACIYARTMDTGEVGALGWLLLNNFFAIGDRLLQRLMLAKDQDPVDMSKTAITLVNNAAGALVLAVALVVHGEARSLPGAVAALSGADLGWILASCVVSVGISYCGIWAQSLVTATTFLVLVNANKFFVIFLEAMAMNKQMTRTQLFGACVVLFASVAYGKAREAAESELAMEKETTPIAAKAV